jgi:hypothetical protein
MAKGLTVDTLASIADFPAMHIDPTELNDVIETRGIGAELRRGVLCPCIRIDTNSPRSGCEACKGIGYVYPSNLRESIIVLLLSRDSKQRDLAAGRMYQGGATALFPTGLLPARGDLLLPDGEEHVVQQVLYRQIQQLDPGVLKGRRGTPEELAPADGPLLERLLYPDAGEIEVVFYVTQPANPTKPLVECFEGTDYVREDDRLVWRPGRGPAPARGYTVRYRAAACYILGDAAPAFRSEGGGGVYPYRVHVERLDRWGEPDLRPSK